MSISIPKVGDIFYYYDNAPPTSHDRFSNNEAHIFYVVVKTNFNADNLKLFFDSLHGKNKKENYLLNAIKNRIDLKMSLKRRLDEGDFYIVYKSVTGKSMYRFSFSYNRYYLDYNFISIKDFRANHPVIL